MHQKEPFSVSARELKPLLGSGSFANASIIEIDFGDIKLPAVLKKFHAPENCLEELEPILAIDGYQLLKELGLKVPSIYLLIPKSRSILMPFLGSEYVICVGPNNPARCSVQLWGHELLDEIPNLEDVWVNLVSDVTKAANQKIFIANDAQFYLWDTKHNKLEYVFADFDNVNQDTSTSAQEVLLLNIKHAYISLDRFIQSNINRDKKTSVRLALNEIIKKAVPWIKEDPLKNWSLPAPKLSKLNCILRYPTNFDF